MADNEIAISVRHIHAYGSTIVAATELGIYQSTASRLFHQLELYLGIDLFERDKDRLSITREGLALRPEIRAISDRLAAFKETARELERVVHWKFLCGSRFPQAFQ